MAARILIVDDDPIQRRLLEEAVKRFGHEAVTADGGEAGLAMLVAARGDFQLMILDLVMPDLDGMAVLERLAKAGETLPVIVQTSRGSIATVVGAMRAGAFDFIEKPFADEALLGSIRRGLAAASAPAAAAAAHSGPSAAVAAKLALLTPRERDVLEHLVRGSPHKVIAHALGISPRTVEVHRARIMAKLEARNLAHLVEMMLTSGTMPAARSSGASPPRR